MDINELKSQAQTIEPCVRIGKNGLTDSMVKEIVKVLNKRKLIKIKLLRAFIQDKDRKILAQEIADKTKSKLVQLTGFTVILYKR